MGIDAITKSIDAIMMISDAIITKMTQLTSFRRNCEGKRRNHNRKG